MHGNTFILPCPSVTPILQRQHMGRSHAPLPQPLHCAPHFHQLCISSGQTSLFPFFFLFCDSPSPSPSLSLPSPPLSFFESNPVFTEVIERTPTDLNDLLSPVLSIYVYRVSPPPSSHFGYEIPGGFRVTHERCHEEWNSLLFFSLSVNICPPSNVFTSLLFML